MTEHSGARFVEHYVEVVVQPRPSRRDQAMCFCGWKGPVRLFVTDALEDALIPDLRESGSDATADDFDMCADMIEQLLDERARRASA